MGRPSRWAAAAWLSLAVCMRADQVPVDESRRTAWAATYNDYVKQGVVAAKDAYTGVSTGWAFAGTAPRPVTRQARWTLLSSHLYSRWEHEPQPSGRVVAVLSTTPQRIHGMKPALDSVLTQSFPLDAVYAFVPHFLKRTGEGYTIPGWLQDYNESGRIVLLRCDDMGPGTAVYAVLDVETDRRTSIFKVDDDQYYGPNTLRMLLRAQEVMPGRALTTETSQIYPHVGGVVLQGVHGILLQRSFFAGTNDSLDFKSAAGEHMWEFCWLNDDLWMTMQLARRGFRRESLELRQGSRVLDIAYQSDALYKGGAGTDNYENFYMCNAAVVRQYPTLWDSAPRVVVLVAAAQHEDLYAMLAALQVQQEWPHQLYMCGSSGWHAFHFGPWYAGCLITPLPGCHPRATTKDLIEVGANLEMDPETILIAGAVGAFHSPLMIKGLAGCVRQKKLSHEADHTYCSIPGGVPPEHQVAVGIWRGRLGAGEKTELTEAMFMPLFDQGAPASTPAPAAGWAPLLPPAGNQFVPTVMRHPSAAVLIHVRAPAASASAWAAAEILLGDGGGNGRRLGGVGDDGLRVERVYLAGAAGRAGAADQDLRIEVLPARVAPIEELIDVARRLGHRTALVRLSAGAADAGAALASRARALLGVAARRPGAALGLRGVAYRGLPVLLGPTLYPPGSLGVSFLERIAASAHTQPAEPAEPVHQSAAPPPAPRLPAFSDPGHCRCCGATELWLAAGLASRGVPMEAAPAAVGGHEALDNSTSVDEPAWAACFESFWPSWGWRLPPARRSRRVVLFVLPPRAVLLKDLPESEVPALKDHLAAYNIELLKAQGFRPSMAYMLVPAGEEASALGMSAQQEPAGGTLRRWVGGEDGLEVVAVRCDDCRTFQDSRFQTAIELEFLPDALLLFASSERLLNDQLVAEHVDCAERMIVGRKYKGACGAGLRSEGHIADFSMLRDHIAQLLLV